MIRIPAQHRTKIPSLTQDKDSDPDLAGKVMWIRIQNTANKKHKWNFFRLFNEGFYLHSREETIAKKNGENKSIFPMPLMQYLKQNEMVWTADEENGKKSST